MEHPFIKDLHNLSLDDLQTKISELMNKLTFASKMGNKALISQLQMALESYRNAYDLKMSEMMKGATQNIKIEKKNAN